MLYKARILQKTSGFSGELTRGVRIEYQLDGYTTATAAVFALNKKIREYNAKHNLNIPVLGNSLFFVSYETDEHDDNPIILPPKEIRPLPAPKPVQTRRKSTQERTTKMPTRQAVSSKPKSAKTAETAPKAEPKPTKPKRKPFTPYGLNGYLVDKQGNVRLMLDRRANAQTIVLTPEMFSSLAEMVKKTQEQHNAN